MWYWRWSCQLHCWNSSNHSERWPSNWYGFAGQKIHAVQIGLGTFSTIVQNLSGSKAEWDRSLDWQSHRSITLGNPQRSLGEASGKLKGAPGEFRESSKDTPEISKQTPKGTLEVYNHLFAVVQKYNNNKTNVCFVNSNFA